MATESGVGSSQRMLTLASVALVVATLYFAKGILFPVALAVLLTFLLAPAVNLLERWKLGRIAPVLLVVTSAGVLLAGLSWLMVAQVIGLVEDLPNHEQRILQKIQTLRGTGEGWLGRATRSVERIIERSSAKSLTTAEAPTEVTVVETPTTAIERVKVWAGPTLEFLGVAAVVAVFVIFMLLARRDLRNRFLRLAGENRLRITTEALDEAASRVSRYLRMQVLINASYGVTLACGLALLQVPNAVLWGILAAVLRFIPYVGPWIAAAAPIALSLAVFEGFTRPLLVIGWFVIIELVSNNVLEPWLYGQSTGLSEIGIISAAVFWTWIWGAAGLILATPLTVCLMVMGRYIPQMRFLKIMLSDEPPLSPAAIFFQRLLAGDQDEALEVAEKALAAGSMQSLFEDVLLPALALSEQDRHRGLLDDRHQQTVHETLANLLDELAERPLASPGKQDPTLAMRPTANLLTVVCFPAHDFADELAGRMLTQLLSAEGLATSTMSVKALANEMAQHADEVAADVVCISALPPLASTYARYLCKRLKARNPRMKVIVGMWETDPARKGPIQRLQAAGADQVVHRLGEAVEEIQRTNPTSAPRHDLAVAAAGG